jgi:hypothetical protein
VSITALELKAKVTADTKSAEDALQRVQQSADDASGQKSGGGLKGILSHMLPIAGGLAIFHGVAGGVRFLADQLEDSVEAAKQYGYIQAQTAAALKSTHDASGQTAQSIADLAEHFSRLTPFSEEATQSAENMLLTFTGISGKTFPAATQATLDMATALHTDATTAALQLGKALNDPATGMARLQREGVTFTKQQMEQAKAMEKAGNLAGAQSIVLQELQREFGGSADAAGKTFGGALQIAQNQLEDVKVKIGTAILPILTQLMSAIAPLIAQFAQWLPGALKVATTWFNANLKPALTELVDVISTKLVPAAITVAQHVGDFISFLQTHQPVFEALKAALAGAAVVIATLLVAAFISWATTASAAAVATIAATLPLIVMGAAIGVTILIIKRLIDHFGGLGNIMKSLGGIAKSAWASVTGAIKGEANAIIDVINGLIKAINSIHVNIPKIGPIGGGTIGFNLPTIPHLAAGGTALQGGDALVGENGPEILRLPRGASVLPLSAGLGGSGPIVVHVQVTGNFTADGRKLAQVTLPHIHTILRNATGHRSF